MCPAPSSMLRFLFGLSSYTLTQRPWVHIYFHDHVSEKKIVIIHRFLCNHPQSLALLIFPFLDNDSFAYKWEGSDIDISFRAMPSSVSDSLNIDEKKDASLMKVGNVLIYEYNDKSLQSCLILCSFIRKKLFVYSLLGLLICLVHIWHQEWHDAWVSSSRACLDPIDSCLIP